MAKHRRRGRNHDTGDGCGRSGPRAMWKGAITFGLVTVPVALHAATERKTELSFRLLHAKDESPIDYKRFCEEEGVEVPWREISRRPVRKRPRPSRSATSFRRTRSRTSISIIRRRRPLAVGHGATPPDPAIDAPLV